LRDVMAFQKNWNNEIIAQFYATLYVEEWGGGHEEVPLDDRGKMV
jgi:hypothetical protein